jgi:hypothetical protein
VVAVPVVMAALGVGAGALHYHRSTADLVTPPPPVFAARASADSAAPDSDLGPSEVATSDVSDLALPDLHAHGIPASPVRDHLREESLLLARARAELRGGNARAAQAILARMQTKFPRGALSQEREVLVIESLAARGNTVAAERSARVFVAAHPESPHAVQMRRYLEQHPEAREN